MHCDCDYVNIHMYKQYMQQVCVCVCVYAHVHMYVCNAVHNVIADCCDVWCSVFVVSVHLY